MPNIHIEMNFVPRIHYRWNWRFLPSAYAMHYYDGLEFSRRFTRKHMRWCDQYYNVSQLGGASKILA